MPAEEFDALLDEIAEFDALDQLEQAQTAPLQASLTTIAFGSCRDQNRERGGSQPIWGALEALRPQLFVWLGDSIYAGLGATPSSIRKAYGAAHANSDVERFLASVPFVDGVYDDHDFGENDAGRFFQHREAARQLFLDHVVHAPVNSPRRMQRGGLYGARTFGTAPRQVKLVMLDTRYSRDHPSIPSVGASRWLPKPGYVAAAVRVASALGGVGREHAGDVLGAEQATATPRA